MQALLPRTLDPVLAFFEVFVRGNGDPSEVPRVAWNLAGTSEMRCEDRWPPAASRTVTLFASEAGALSIVEAAEAVEATWTHDPLDLVSSSVPDAFSYLLHLADEAPIGERDDVLVFTSAAAQESVELAGPVRARARVQTSGPVMDCFVWLLDVVTGGTALRIARGQLQLRDATHPERLDI